MVAAGTTQDAPEWIPDGVTHDLAGVVVEAGAGASPDDCLFRGPNYAGIHGAAADVLAPARWFRLEDAAGTVWTVWLLLGEQTPALAPGEAVLVHSFYRMEPFAPSPGHLLVTRPGGGLVAWFGTDGTAEALAPPDDVTLARGPAVCAQSDDCGAWAGHALNVTVGESAATVAYGETATVGGLRVVHGGQRLQTTTEAGCADWFVADVAVALVPLPAETPQDEPRPRALWPGPCATARRLPDGTAFESWRYGYDAAGNVTREEWDATADGAVDTIVTRTYDEAGRLTSVRVEGTGEELEAGNDRNVWVYEGDRLVREEHEDASGVVDQRVTYTYDDAGRLLTKEGDAGADGTVDWRWTHTYDAAGNHASEDFDQDADGEIDQRDEWTWDAAGRLATERHDEDADGRPERLATHTWYAAGHAIETLRDEGVAGCCFGGSGCHELTCAADGTVDRREQVVETLDGRRLLSVWDGGAAGGPAGGPDGVPDGREEWTWHPAGRLLRLELRDAAGALVSWLRLTYDAHGDLAERVSENDGSPESQRWVYQRDAVGNLLEEALHTPSTAEAPAVRITHEYDCWE